MEKSDSIEGFCEIASTGSRKRSNGKAVGREDGSVDVSGGSCGKDCGTIKIV